MNGPLKLAIFEPYVFDRMYGNLRYIITLFQRFDRERIEPELVVPRYAEILRRVSEVGGSWRLIEAPGPLRVHGGAILRSGIVSKLAVAWSLVRYGRDLGRHLRRSKVDVLQCHSIRALITIGPFARLCGCPVLWYVKGELSNPILDRIGFLLAHKVLFQGETNLRRRYPLLRRLFRSRLGILPNGIDLEEIEAARSADAGEVRRRLGVGSERLLVGFVGQLAPFKGVDDLLRAAGKVRNVAPMVHFVVVGDAGASEYETFAAAFEKRARAGLGEDGITFVGWRKDVLEIMTAFDLVVLPSHEEGMPKSIIEAMAMGKAVVATRLGSVADLVRDGQDGIVVAPRDPAGLASAILALVREPELREQYGSSARARALARHSIEKNVRGLEEQILLLAGANPLEAPAHSRNGLS